MKKNKEMIKILVWGDTPYCNTGFGHVTRGIFGELSKTGRYLIDIIGINETGGWHDPNEFPNLRVWPAMPGASVNGDFHGRGRLAAAIFNKDPEIVPPWDIIFTINDPFILDQKFKDGLGTMGQIIRAQLSYILNTDPRAWFKVVSYWPVDSKLKPNWIRDTISLPDISVAYSQYGIREILAANERLMEKKNENIQEKLCSIPHGADLDIFFPISDEEKKAFKKEFFEGKAGENTFIISAIARNQMRKDLPRTLKIFAEFKKKRPDSLLYINAKETDAWGSLKEIGFELGLNIGEDFLVPDKFNERVGIPAETLNKVLNVSDVLLSTSLSEGWGLSSTDAMAAGCLTLLPFNSTTPEILNLKDTEIHMDARGLAYKSGSNKTEWIFLGPQDLMRERPLGNVEDAVEKLLWIYGHPNEAKQIAENGHKWVQSLSWKNISKEWDALFIKLYNGLEEDRRNKDKVIEMLKEKLGLNKDVS